MVVCFGGLFFGVAASLFWWLVPNLSFAAVPAQAPTQPRAKKRRAPTIFDSTTASHHAVSERCILHRCLSVPLGQLSLPGGFLCCERSADRRRLSPA